MNEYIHSRFEEPIRDKKTKKTSNEKSNKSKNKNNKKTSNLENLVPERKRLDLSSSSGESSAKLESTSPVHRLAEKVKEYIGHLDYVPEFLKDNDFLHTGHRINFNTPKKVLKSLFMLHNEFVNIWTHLGGAIILIIICVVLCFSVSSNNTQNFNNFVQNEVKDLFTPIYDRLPAIDLNITSKISQTTGDIAKFGETTLVGFEKTLESISEEIEYVAKNVNAENIGKLLNNLKAQLEGVSVEGLKNSVTSTLEKEKIGASTDLLKAKLNDLQKQVVISIDSEDFDWIDIYRYVNPSYNPSTNPAANFREVPLSRWPIIVFLLSAVFCLTCSAVFHLFCCLSSDVYAVLHRLDYAGISILITGSCFPALVYGFYCEPIYAQIYLSIIGGTSIVVFFISLGDKIHKPEYATHKALMYGGLGIFAATPIIHLVYSNMTAPVGSDKLDFMPSLPHYLTMGACYLGGLALYSTKCPERLAPGKFDIWGHSHQIWHVCVLLGIVFTYFGAFDNYYTRIRIPCVGCGL